MEDNTGRLTLLGHLSRWHFLVSPHGGTFCIRTGLATAWVSPRRAQHQPPSSKPVLLEAPSGPLGSDNPFHPRPYRQSYPTPNPTKRSVAFTLWSSSHCCRSSSVSNEIPSSPSSRLPEKQRVGQSTPTWPIPGAPKRPPKPHASMSEASAQPPQDELKYSSASCPPGLTSAPGQTRGRAQVSSVISPLVVFVGGSRQRCVI